MNQIYRCQLCDYTGHYEEFPHMTIKIRDKIRRRERPLNNAILLCSKCHTDKSKQFIIRMFKGMCARNLTLFNKSVDFSLRQFWDFCMSKPFRKSILEYKKKKGVDIQYKAPSLDRINVCQEYRLDNIQIVSTSYNSSKGNRPVVGALLKAMRFFKKLREERKLSKYEMANHLGILPPTYYYLEDQAKGCSFKILCLIKRKLGLTWEELGKRIEEEFGSLDDFSSFGTVRRKKK